MHEMGNAREQETRVDAKATRFSVGAWVGREFRRYRCGTKIAAVLFGRSNRTVEGWIYRGRRMSADDLAEALRHPKFRENFLRALDEHR